ncbi:MAG: D-tyrosyl-tRNA(Tyr) deacylase [Chlorobi bacterium]|nr:D-tyrosyl-tRNA(Tyr) deacylase [Chlorobiota bacterium]
MRTVIQRVTEAEVRIDGQTAASIGPGLVLLVGFEEADTSEDIDWLVHKAAGLRIFSDREGKMNLSVKDIGGEVLIVSQFTLHAKTKKGFRPSFARAARPETAVPLYEEFIRKFEETLPGKVRTGRFGAMMQVALVNDGPVTIVIDTKNKE